MRESLAKNMIKEAIFSKLFSNSSQMMLKLCRNIPWVDSIRLNLKILITSSQIQKYDVIIVILKSGQLRKRKVFIVSLFLDGLN